jgi:hypothetical protein
MNESEPSGCAAIERYSGSHQLSASTASALTRRNISVSEVAPAPGALPWPPHTQGGSAELGKLARQEVAVPRRSTLLGLGLI